MSQLDELVQSSPIPSWRPFAYLIITVLVAAIVWSTLAELEEVATADAAVVPRDQIKVIQHLEGGIIQVIHVREGDTVEEDQPLLQLVLGTQTLNRNELQARLESQVLTRARYEAQAQGEDLAFPPDVAARQPTIVASERRAFESRASELNSTIAGLRSQVEQRGLEVQEFVSRRAQLIRELGSNREKLESAREKESISADLLERGLTTRVEHIELEQEALDLQKDINKTEGDIEIVEVAIPRTRTAQREVEERIREVRLTFRREANERLAEVDGEIASTRELLAQASAQQQRAVITSPIGGTVKNLLINTVGGVVQPGQPIMEIVPGGENLIVEAKLNPIDIGFIEVGQPAMVKLTTYDFVRYGGLEGTVIEVAPDSTIEENGDPYFRVRVETEKTYLGDEPGDLPIFAGMVATVDIKTGTKSVAKYLIRPVLKLRYEAFRER